VGRGGYRKKLGDPLDDAEDERVEQRHAVGCVGR
jgi:hypothetical protein